MRVKENICRWRKGPVQVRVWFDNTDDETAAYISQALLTAICKRIEGEIEYDSTDEVAELLLKELPDSVNAIEVMYVDHGTLIYPDWP